MYIYKDTFIYIYYIDIVKSFHKIFQNKEHCSIRRLKELTNEQNMLFKSYQDGIKYIQR
jgi:hypothetical protein